MTPEERSREKFPSEWTYDDPTDLGEFFREVEAQVGPVSVYALEIEPLSRRERVLSALFWAGLGALVATIATLLAVSL